MTTEENPPPERESIWSIPSRWQTAYFTLFAIQNIAGISLVCWYEIAGQTQDGAVQTILNIMDRNARIAIGAAGSTITIMEVARFIMVIGGHLERWLRKREDERVERAVDMAVGSAVDSAVDSTNQAWAEWLERKADAEAKGEPFTEPRPDSKPSERNGPRPG